MKLGSRLFIAFLFLTPSVILSQNSAVRKQAEAFWLRFRNEIEPQPIVMPACPDVKELQGNVSFWINEVDRLRVQGAYDCCLKILNQIENTARHNDKEYVLWLMQKTRILITTEKFDEAETRLKELEKLTARTNTSVGMYELVLAWCHDGKRNFQGALKSAENALNIARKSNDKAIERQALEQIAYTSRDIYMQEPTKYAPLLQQVYEIAQSLNDTASMFSDLLGLSLCYLDEGSIVPEKAEPYLTKAFELTKSPLTVRQRLKLATILSYFLEVNGLLDQSLEVKAYSTRLSKALNARASTQNIYELMSGLYEEKGDYDKALEMMDSAKAYCDFNRELGYFYAGYARLYEAKGNISLANNFYKKAFDEQVKGYTNRNAALLTETETRLRTQEKELELKRQQGQRWLLLGIAFLASLLCGLAFWAYWRNKKQVVLLKNQKALIEKQEAELRQLDAAKTRFFANVSHELRTPLTLILGPLSHLLKTNELNNRQFTTLSLIKQNAQNLLQLTNEILDLSKLEAGKMQFNAEPTVLYPFMRRLVASFESHAERQNIRLTFDYKPDRYLQLALDKNKFEKVINNLLSNAIKFTPPNGAITVVVVEKPNQINIEVKDTGRGIHPDDLPHVFNRFYQSNQPDAPTEGGTGIGLSLSMEFAKLFGGNLWVESELNKGSTFYFSFPKREVMGTIPQDAALEIKNGHPIQDEIETHAIIDTDNPVVHDTTILIVEDNPSLRDYLKSILIKKYNIITAENGLAALDVLGQNITSLNAEQSPIKLIVSDIMMPMMDGFQFLEVLKNRDYFKQIPVIMLTARADVRDKLKALRIGVDDYLIKPFDEEELLARVENLLKNSAQRHIFTHELAQNQALTEGVAKALDVEVEGSQKDDLNEYNAWLEALEAVIQKHIGDFNLTSDTVADHMAMSRSQFFRRLKVATGLTPNQYLLEVRFNHARQLLELRKESTVKAVAYSVGMRDVKYFSQQFKERFGKLPSDYLNLG